MPTGNTSSLHLPPSTLEQERLERLDRLALFVEVRGELAHLSKLMRELERGAADLEATLPMLGRAGTRLARALNALAEK